MLDSLNSLGMIANLFFQGTLQIRLGSAPRGTWQFGMSIRPSPKSVSGMILTTFITLWSSTLVFRMEMHSSLSTRSIIPSLLELVWCHERCTREWGLSGILMSVLSPCQKYNTPRKKNRYNRLQRSHNRSIVSTCSTWMEQRMATKTAPTKKLQRPLPLRISRRLWIIDRHGTHALLRCETFASLWDAVRWSPLGFASVIQRHPSKMSDFPSRVLITRWFAIWPSLDLRIGT